MPTQRNCHRRSLASLLPGLVLALTAALATSCGGGMTTPTPVGTSAISIASQEGMNVATNLAAGVRQANIEVCHARGGDNPYALLTIAQAALAAHMQHGDGRIGDGVPGRPGVVFGADCAAVVVCTAAPGAPGFLGWTTAGLATGSVRMNWDVGSGTVTSYVLEVGTTVGGSDVAVIDTGNTATSYLLTGLITSVDKYHVRVRAKNPCGASATSNEANPRVA